MSLETHVAAVMDAPRGRRRVEAEQTEKIAGFGGRAAIESRGSFAYSPAPGTEAVYN